MHLIHNDLGRLVDVCSNDFTTRVSTTGVELTCGESGYTAVATDGRRLIVVEAEYPHDAAEYPKVPALDLAPNGKAQAVIPGKAWKATMTKANKAVKRIPKAIIRESLAVVIGENETTMGVTNLESATVESTPNIMGRFPNWRLVTPRDEDAEYRIAVDPQLLGEALLAVAALGNDDETKRCEILLQANSPLKITAAARGRRVTALVVPLTGGKGKENGPIAKAKITKEPKAKASKPRRKVGKVEGK